MNSTLAHVRSLPPAAAVAMLTLQLRAAEQEYLDLEAQLERINVDAAKRQIRIQLGSLAEVYRQRLAVEVDESEPTTEPIVEPIAEPEWPPLFEPAPLPPISVPHAPAIVEPCPFPAVPVPAWPPLLEPVPLPPLSIATEQPVVGWSTTINAETLGQIVAAAVSAALADGGLARSERTVYEASRPVPARKSTWRDAMHIDVFLLGLATLIVLVVVMTWMA